MTSRFVAALCCTSALCAFSAFDGAQAQQAAQPAASTGPGQLEEIVVTARKTEEKLQVSPVSITAISATKLESQNVTAVTNLNGLAPNLNVSQGSGYGTACNVTIRGVNQADNVLTNDAPVAIYIDGVYNGRQIGCNFDLVDLEQVQVLRGPQGTLFGRNTTGGALDIHTKGPSDDFSIEQKLEYGSYNDFHSRTVVNTGEIGNTGLKALLAYSHHQDDGYVHNTLLPRDEGFGSVDSDSFFFDLHGDVLENLSFDYRIDYTHEHDFPEADSLTVVSPFDKAYFGASPNYGGAPLVVSPGRLPTDSSYNAGPPNLDEVYGHALTVNWDIADEFRLKSISAYRSFADDSHSDQTGQGLLKGLVFDAKSPTFVSVQQVGGFVTLCPGDTPNFPSNTCDHQRQYQLSQEVQATGTVGEFKYVGGLFFFDEKVHEQDPEFLTVVLPTSSIGFPAFIPGFPSVKTPKGRISLIGFQAYPVTNYYSESKSFAAYGQTSYRPDFLDDKFEFTAGLRYTYDQKTIQLKDFSADNPSVITDHPVDPTHPLGGPFFGAKNFHNLSYLVSGSYQLTDDVFAYAKISSAYKSGGFSARTPGDQYNPEQDTTYEGGIKSEWFDHHLRINADFFYAEYDDAQINVFTEDPVTHAAASVTTNAGSLNYTGGELELSVIPAEGWLIDGSFGYTDPQFNQFLNAVTLASGKVVTENFASQAIDNYTSKMTYAIGVQYDFEPFTFGDLEVRADYNFASPKTFHPLTAISPLNEIIKSQNYHTLNAYALLKDIQTDYGTWQAKFFVQNLLDEDQRYAGIDFEIAPGSSFGNNSYNPPRTFGFELTYKFEPTEHSEAAQTAYVAPAPVAPMAAPKSYLVFFDFNKSDLTPQAVTIVDQAAHNAGPAKVTQLTVTGHTDTVGSDAYNMRLSRRRAESVAAQLEKDGIPSSEIEIVAKGKRDLLVPTADGVKEPQNRRVQIVYDNGASS